MAIKRLCNYPNCNNFALDGHIYCGIHYKEPKPFENAKRSNEGLYNTSKWRKLRKEHLNKEPYCIKCGATEDLTVDHIADPLGNEFLFFDKNNLQTLCKSCHRIKTSAEIQQRKRNHKNDC